MTTRTKAALALVLLLAAAVFLAVRVSAGGGRHPRLRARLDLVERHFADLTTSSDTVEARLQALAIRVADLETRLAECHCVPPPTCTPCTCAAAGAACGQDADGDGVDDCLDRCPCEPGPSDQAGCPGPPPPPPCSPCPCVFEGGPCGHDADHDGIDDCTDGNGCSLDVCMGGVCEHKCLCLGPAGFDCRPGPAR